jgi:hypothetical protein
MLVCFGTFANGTMPSGNISSFKVLLTQKKVERIGTLKKLVRKSALMILI